MKNMSVAKFIMIHFLFTLLLAVPMGAKAQDFSYADYGQGGHGGYGSELDDEIPVQQYLSGFDEIRLSDLVYGQSGSISIRAQAISQRGILIIKSNGAQVDTRVLSPMSSIISLPSHLPLHSLTLSAAGEIFIEGIIVQNSYPGPGPGPHPGPIGQNISIELNQQFRGNGMIPVKALLQQQGIDLSGAQIAEVILTATSAQGQGSATLLINHQAVASSNLPNREQRIRLVNTSRLLNLQSVQVQVQGNVFVRRIEVKLAGQGQQHGEMQVAINRTIHGQRVSLSSIVSPRARNEMRPIRSIRFNAMIGMNSALMITDASQGIVLGTITMNGQTLQLPHGTRLQDIMIRARGVVTLQSISIRL